MNALYSDAILAARHPLWTFCLLSLAALGGCGGSDDGTADSGGEPSPAQESGGGEAKRVTVAGSDALLWGEGPYGVVLAHGAVFDAASWAPQAELIAEQGMAALAVEDISPESILAAMEYLKAEGGATEVALVGGSAGADAILQAAAQRAEAPDQLILLSANSEVAGLGSEPKLFVASEDEPVADVSRSLARGARGTENEALLLPGDAHAQNIFDSDHGEALTRTILDRLNRFTPR